MSFVNTVKTPNFEMDYIRFGAGTRTLVVIPGMSLKSVMLLASLVAESYKIFDKDYTVYLFDRKKHFESGYSVKDMARDTVEAVKAVGVENADFYGISQGGAIALTIAENWPQLVHRLGLASSFSRMNDSSRLVFEEWLRLAKLRDVEALCKNFVKKVFSEKTIEKYGDVLVRSYMDATDEDMERFAVMSQANLENDCYGDLDKVKCPVLVIGAELDQVAFLESSVEIVDKLKSAGTPCEFFVYEGYGHAAYDEARDYRERVLEFLNREF